MFERLVQRITIVNLNDATEFIYGTLVGLASIEPRGFITKNVP
jgi:hypothetical protein